MENPVYNAKGTPQLHEREGMDWLEKAPVLLPLATFSKNVNSMDANLAGNYPEHSQSGMWSTSIDKKYSDLVLVGMHRWCHTVFTTKFQPDLQHGVLLPKTSTVVCQTILFQ